MLEAVAAAGRAAAVAGVEAERARGVAALARQRRVGEQLADARRRRRRSWPGWSARSCRSGDWSTNTTSLDAGRAPSRRSCAPGVSVGLAVALAQRRRTARPAPACDLPEPETPVTQTRRCSGNSTSMSLQVVLARAVAAIRRGVSASTVRRDAPMPTCLRAAEVGAGQRVGVAQRASGVPSKHDLRRRARPGPGPCRSGGRRPASPAGSCSTTTSVLPASRSRCMHLDDAVHVARVQADARLVEHEQRVDQRGAERRGQVDALHLAAATACATGGPASGSRGRRRTGSAGACGSRRAAARSPRRAAPGRHQLRRRSAAARSIGSSIRSCRLRPGSASSCSRDQATPTGRKRCAGGQHRVGVGLAAEAPQQRLGLQPRAAAGRAGRVAAVLRQQHADVHLVGLGLQVLEEAAHAVPAACSSCRSSSASRR